MQHYLKSSCDVLSMAELSRNLTVYGGIGLLTGSLQATANSVKMPTSVCKAGAGALATGIANTTAAINLPEMYISAYALASWITTSVADATPCN
jgi:hypothetical protein